MIKFVKLILLALSLCILIIFCTQKSTPRKIFTGQAGEVQLITLDPGHFHAALVQKVMYPQVNPTVHVYAPDGPDVADHQNRIGSFNSRTVDPTRWIQKVYQGTDFLEKMLIEKPGNVVVLSGNNLKKTEYIKKAVDAGLNVLADKPMCITLTDFEMLKQAFKSAEKQAVLIYDIMTERYEIPTILQRELVNDSSVFGKILSGTPTEPAIIKQSVHHLFKLVAGKPNKRPAWFFDVTQQGEGIVDVSAHLVDLVQWICFPEKIINYQTDIQVLDARHWPTKLNLEQFEKITRLTEYPDYLTDKIDSDGNLNYYCNGEIRYQINGIYAKIVTLWNYEPPEGGGDTHYSMIHGTKANIFILQDAEQNNRPELYIQATTKVDNRAMESALKNVIHRLQDKYPGVMYQKEADRFHIVIPDHYYVGHEAHFGEVTQKYLHYLVEGKLPDWEIPNMIAKYYVTTKALEMAIQHDNK